MAIAWATAGSAHLGDPDLLAVIIAAVETTLTNHYKDGLPEDASWYNFEIGIPQSLNNILILVRGEVADELVQRYVAAVDWYVPDPRDYYPPDSPNHKPSTGGNRTDICQVVIIRGVLDHTAERIADARDAISGVLSYTTSGDGFYRDGGYIQHTTIPYTATYGSILLRGAATLLGLLAGSPWEVTDSNVEIMFDAVENCYVPVVHNNQTFSHVSGRAISRKSRVEHGPSYDIADGMLTLAPAVDVARAKRWREICLGWFERSTFTDPLNTTDLRRMALFKGVLNDADLTPATEPVEHRLMSSVARPLHRRRSWMDTVWMFTVSTAREGTHSAYESSRENMHGWYTGRGQTYLYVDNDDAQFTDAFWVTVDPLRLPGITAQRRNDMPDGEWRPAYGYFAGGACVDQTYAATGMRMSKGPGEHALSAVKSWFCLDDSVVALGSNIFSDGTFGIETVLENRNLHESGVQKLIVDGAVQPVDQGWTDNLGQPGWLHLEGTGGYLLLGGGDDLIALREERTATWLDINPYWSTHDDTPYTQRYLTLYFDHGKAPSNAGYGYVIMPGASPEQTAERAADPQHTILSQTDTTHAIYVDRLGFVGANFFSVSEVDLAGVDLTGGGVLRSENVASVDTSERDGRTHRAVLVPG